MKSAVDVLRELAAGDPAKHILNIGLTVPLGVADIQACQMLLWIMEQLPTNTTYGQVEDLILQTIRDDKDNNLVAKWLKQNQPAQVDHVLVNALWWLITLNVAGAGKPSDPKPEPPKNDPRRRIPAGTLPFGIRKPYLN